MVPHGSVNILLGLRWLLDSTSFAPTSWFLTLSVAVLGASIGALDVAMNGWGAEVERGGVKSIISSLHAYWSLSAGIGGLVGLTAIKLGFSIEQHFCWWYRSWGVLRG